MSQAGWEFDGDLWICQRCETGYDEPTEHDCKPPVPNATPQPLALTSRDETISKLQAEVEQLRQLFAAAALGKSAAEHRVAALATERDTLCQRCEALEAALEAAENALKFIYPELRKLAQAAQMPLSTVGALLRRQEKRDAAISAQPHAQSNGGKD